MSNDYRVVALEEHMVTAEVIAAWQKLEPRWRDLALIPSTQGESGRGLAEVGDERIAAMDDAEIDVQVLSLTAPGLQNLEPADAIIGEPTARRSQTGTSGGRRAARCRVEPSTCRCTTVVATRGRPAQSLASSLSPHPYARDSVRRHHHGPRHAIMEGCVFPRGGAASARADVCC